MSIELLKKLVQQKKDKQNQSNRDVVNHLNKLLRTHGSDISDLPELDRDLAVSDKQHLYGEICRARFMIKAIQEAEHNYDFQGATEATAEIIDRAKTITDPIEWICIWKEV